MTKGRYRFERVEGALGEQYAVFYRNSTELVGFTDVTDKDGRDWFAVGQNLFQTPEEAAGELERRNVVALVRQQMAGSGRKVERVRGFQI